VHAVQALYGAYRNLPVIHGMQEVWGSNPHSSTQGHAHNSNSEPVTGPAPEGHLRGSFAASVITVGLLTCGGAEDGPALSVMSRIDDVQEVPSSASEGGRLQQALNTRRSVAGDVPAA
jgi:hypothetical protein